jgi:hypothetical protein
MAYEQANRTQRAHLSRIVEHVIAMLQDCRLSLLEQGVSFRNRHRNSAATQPKPLLRILSLLFVFISVKENENLACPNAWPLTRLSQMNIWTKRDRCGMESMV